MLAFLIDQPFLALIPSVLFFIGGTAAKSRLAQGVGISWLLYCLYELGMKYRITCSGECNIRVDLLLIYPLLIAASIGGAIAMTLAWRKRSNP